MRKATRTEVNAYSQRWRLSNTVAPLGASATVETGAIAWPINPAFMINAGLSKAIAPC